MSNEAMSNKICRIKIAEKKMPKKFKSKKLMPNVENVERDFLGFLEGK